MGENNPLHDFCSNFYQKSEEIAKNLNTLDQLNRIDSREEIKKRQNSASFKNRVIEDHNPPRLLSELTIKDQESLEIEAKLLESFQKEFIDSKEIFEDYLIENYTLKLVKKRLARIIEAWQIKNDKKPLETEIEQDIKNSQEKNTSKVKNGSSEPSSIPVPENSLILTEKLPKTQGDYITEERESENLIDEENLQSINLQNYRMQESVVWKLSDMQRIEGKKIIKNFDKFLIGCTEFDFTVKAGEWVSVECLAPNESTFREWNWTDNSKISIGRGGSNTIKFPEDMNMSKRHATIEFSEENWVIIDNRSKNGVWSYSRPFCELGTIS